MAIARCKVVTEGVEAVYHCISSYVRRACLWGTDTQSGQSHERRKELIRLRFLELAAEYGMEISAYAVTSNHLHLVLKTRPDWVESWSDREVAVRWLRLFSRYRATEDKSSSPSDNEINALTGNDPRSAELRLRRCNVSRFIRSLN